MTCMHDSGSRVAQDGGHTPATGLIDDRDMQAWFIHETSSFGHPCYCQLTPVKTRYQLTSKTTISWAQVKKSLTSCVFWC